MKALVLSGGGARGAYQVGVLKAVGELARENELSNPFQIFCGASAGAINAAFLAATCQDFALGTEQLTDLWNSLSSDRVFKSDVLSLGKVGLQWMGDFSFGSTSASIPSRALLDTEPLLQLLRQNLDFSQVQQNLDSERFHALAITALEYQTSETITFVQGKGDLPSWRKPRRHSEKALIRAEHIMASSAIPLLFPASAVDQRYFGDGCVRNLSPLSPALYLGASEILVIGVRVQNELTPPQNSLLSSRPPSVARVGNVILNSVLLDGIEVDVDRLERINEFIRRVPQNLRANLNFRPVRSLLISPSQDIGKIAAQMSSRLPRVIRYLLKGLGPLEEASEIISYLLFEKDFTMKLIEMGYEDGMTQKKELLQFLLEPAVVAADWEGF